MNVRCLNQKILLIASPTPIDLQHRFQFRVDRRRPYVFPKKTLNAIQHPPLIKPTHLRQQSFPKRLNLLKRLNLILPHYFFKRSDVKVKSMREVKANLAGSSHRFRQIIFLEIVMEDDIVADLRDLSVVRGT